VSEPIDATAIGTFAVATIFETLNPGPTLGLVVALAVAFKTRKVALNAVVGIGAANAAWAAMVFFAFKSGFVTGLVASLIQYFSAGYLVYLASRRIISSMVKLIAYPHHVSSLEATTTAPANMTALSALGAGFSAHALNPLTPPYYVGPFYAATLGSIQATVICGSIAVLSDVVIYGLIVQLIWLMKTEVSKEISLDEYPLLAIAVQLAAGMTFLFLVAHVFSATKVDSRISITAVTTMCMFLGFFAAVIHEVYRFVLGRKGMDNKTLWRLVAMWGTWFSVATVAGGILALYQALSTENVSIDSTVEHRLRICLVVAATLAMACTFAKAFGELQDEQVKAVNGNAVDLTTWHSAPWRAGLAVGALLALVYGALWLTDFSVV
jgi:threonine/homoserine/homoserine lactone efflux protein